MCLKIASESSLEKRNYDKAFEKLRKVISATSRSSHRRCYTKKTVHKNFAIFTGLQKETLTQVFYSEYCEIIKNTYF